MNVPAFCRLREFQMWRIASEFWHVQTVPASQILALPHSETAYYSYRLLENRLFKLFNTNSGDEGAGTFFLFCIRLIEVNAFT